MISERLIEKIKEALEVYNRYHAPEAIAELLEVKDCIIKAVFTGSFCLTCGVRDWIEDLLYVFKDAGIDVALEKVLEPADDSLNIRIGVFRIKACKDDR